MVSLDLPVLTALMVLPGQRDQLVLTARKAQTVQMALPGRPVQTVQMVRTVLMVPTAPTPHNALPLTHPLTSLLTAAITSRCLALTIQA